ncbi:MAG: glycosyltransferase family 39 protein, partial [Terriglobia bacterium]
MKFPRLAWLFGFSILLVGLTRFPLMPAHLFSFDTVNLALALEDFDPTRNQPQPPGYPLFVLEARLVRLLAGTPERTFAILNVLVCGLALGMLYLLGKRMFSPWIGMTAAALLFVNPPFWYSGLTSPLRPHLALLSILVAYCCWRASHGEERYFEWASLVLGLGAGFRPELLVFLFPLWAWTAWQCRRVRLLVRGVFILGLSNAVWLAVLAGSGGTAEIIPTFSAYLFAQTQDTSVLLDATASWRRTAGRAIIWTGLGTLPWIGTLPFAWKDRYWLPDWTRTLPFLALWFTPAFLFHFAVHIGDPDHALSTIPALCLVGGFSIVAAERFLSRDWIPELKERGYLIWL